MVLAFVALSTILTVAPQTASADSVSNHRNPYLAGTLSAMVPGGGYFLEGDADRGLLESTLIIPQIFMYYFTTEDRSMTAIKSNLFFPSVNLLRYCTYRAYQRNLTVMGRQVLILDIPEYSFSELVLSPFDARSYEEGIWGVIPVAGVLSYPVVRTFRNGLDASLMGGDLILSVPLILAQSSLYATGEEAYFRGFIYPAMSELTGSVLAGNLLQSAYFGFCHTELADDLGLRQFPHFTGSIFHFTSTIDEDREYEPPESQSGNFIGMNDLEIFGTMSAFGFGMGLLATTEDGLMKATAIHTLVTGGAILSELLTEGTTGSFMMRVDFPI